jgi:hypothetical protein
MNTLKFLTFVSAPPKAPHNPIFLVWRLRRALRNAAWMPSPDVSRWGMSPPTTGRNGRVEACGVQSENGGILASVGGDMLATRTAPSNARPVGHISKCLRFLEKIGAGEANRTPDPNLGNLIAQA